MAKLVTISVLDFVCEDCLAYTIIRLVLVSAKSRLVQLTVTHGLRWNDEAAKNYMNSSGYGLRIIVRYA